MTRARDIYLLDPACLAPETIAVAFAKTSRSPQSFRQIAAELSDEKSADFHEKWVVGYGHSSVAEHAVLHIAMENISRLAVETVESCRLASYTEKSSRYQVWDADHFFLPPELEKTAERKIFSDTVKVLFDLYLKAIPLVEAEIARHDPLREQESENAYQRRIRSESADVCRYLLPAAALANVGITINARALEHVIRKMLSHPLIEVRSIGEEIKAIALQKVPTLVKYARAVPAYQTSAKAITQLTPTPQQVSMNQDWCRCIAFDKHAEQKALSAALVSHNQISYESANTIINTLTNAQRESILNDYLSPFKEHDIPPRELEHVNYSFEAIIDQGAYFELKRHRMMTQTPQALTTCLGYATPRLIEKAGLLKEYDNAMQKAQACYHAIEKINPHVAAYIVPNAFNRRVLLTFNFRTAMHLISLRSAPNAHFAMRRFACRLANEIRQHAPLLGKYLSKESCQDWKLIEQTYFKSCQ